MEGKVILFDANGTEIGETYARRARQLVKQQRAIWADDTHTAIQFMPDAEEAWELHPKSESAAHTSYPEPDPVSHAAHKPFSSSTAHHTTDTASGLYALAARRMQDRKRIIWHSLLFIPGYFLILFLWMIATNARMFNLSFLTMGFAWGAWTMAFIAHLRTFAKEYGYSLRPKDWETRRRIRLEAEVEHLKRMGYSE